MAIIFYRGKSRYNGKPIVGYATIGSQNAKTGGGVQIWILPEGIHPSEAQKTGDDAAVCGDCEHRPSHNDEHNAAKCYVQTWKAPATIHRSQNNREATPFEVNKAARPYGYMRLGAYGDPIHLPLAVIRELTAGLSFTGYTRQWTKAYAKGYDQYLMASVKDEGQYHDAKVRGWRTFRTAPKTRYHDGLFKVSTSEVLCPASHEAGAVIQCNKCRACNGNATGRKSDIYIPAH